jgi:hypothetical protein
MRFLLQWTDAIRSGQIRDGLGNGAPSTTSATSGMWELNLYTTMIDQVGGPNAVMRFTPNTIAKKMRY